MTSWSNSTRHSNPLSCMLILVIFGGHNEQPKLIMTWKMSLNMASIIYCQNPVDFNQRTSTPPSAVNDKQEMVRELAWACWVSIKNSSTTIDFGSDLRCNVFQRRLEFRWLPNVSQLLMIEVKWSQNLGQSNRRQNTQHENQLHCSNCRLICVGHSLYMKSLNPW